MSGEKEDTKSVNSALIWTDNPELEYFREMVSDRKDEKVASGVDLDDSLLGDSTVREMLEEGDGDKPHSRDDPLKLGERDTSGLSDADNSTIDNIYVEDKSILVMNNLTYRIADNEALESSEALPQHAHHSQEQGCIFPIPNSYQQLQQRNGAPPPLRFSPPKLEIPRGDQQGGNGETQQPANIPGVIFVNTKQSSVIRTDQEAENGVNNDRKDKLGKGICLPRSLIICTMALIVLLAAAVVGVLVVQNQQRNSSAAASAASSNSDLSIPSTNVLPTSEPTSWRATNESPLTTDAPVSQPLAQTPEPSAALDPGVPMAPTTSAFVSWPTLLPATPLPTKPPTTIPATNRPTVAATSVPTFAPTPSPSATTDSPIADPTKRPVSLTSSPTALSTKSISSEPPSATVISTDYPTSWSTWYTTTEFSSGFEIPQPTPETAPAAPSACVASVVTNKSCYRNGENIQISFNNCYPTSEDWIGLFPAVGNALDLRQPVTWLYACGSQFCKYAVDSGEATLWNVSGFGTFRILLVRAADGTGASEDSTYAVGNTFIMSNSCNQ